MEWNGQWRGAWACMGYLTVHQGIQRMNELTAKDMAALFGPEDVQRTHAPVCQNAPISPSRALPYARRQEPARAGQPAL